MTLAEKIRVKILEGSGDEILRRCYERGEWAIIDELKQMGDPLVDAKLGMFENKW